MFIFKSLCFTYGWGSIQDGVLFFQYSFLSGVLLIFLWGGVLIKSGVLMEPIRYACARLSDSLSGNSKKVVGTSKITAV